MLTLRLFLCTEDANLRTTLGKDFIHLPRPLLEGEGACDGKGLSSAAVSCSHRLCYCGGVQRSISSQILGAFSLAFLAINTVLWCIPFYLFGVARVLIPVRAWQERLSRVLMRLAEGWIDCNNFGLDLVHRIQWDMRGFEGLRYDEWYLVSCNHQTWVDIPVLQRTFNRRIPFIKFFLKKELIWVPLLGLA